MLAYWHIGILGGNSYRCRLGSKVRAASVILKDRGFHHGVVHDKYESTSEARWSATGRGKGVQVRPRSRSKRMMLSFNVKERINQAPACSSRKRIKQRSKREEKRETTRRGTACCFFCPGKSRLTGGGGQFGATRIIILPHRLQTRPK